MTEKDKTTLNIIRRWTHDPISTHENLPAAALKRILKFKGPGSLKKI